jgi:hypothetical protein
VTKGIETKKRIEIMSILNWSANDVSFWANWWLAGSLAVGVLSTVAIIVSGNLKEATLRRDLAASQERTAKLEKEAEDARLELAKINPINIPIKLLRADVFLLIPESQLTGISFNSKYFAPRTKDDFTMLLTKQGTETTNKAIWGLLRCTSVENGSTEYPQDLRP